MTTQVILGTNLAAKSIEKRAEILYDLKVWGHWQNIGDEGMHNSMSFTDVLNKCYLSCYGHTSKEVNLSFFSFFFF